jgi:hypothetical protein
MNQELQFETHIPSKIFWKISYHQMAKNNLVAIWRFLNGEQKWTWSIDYDRNHNQPFDGNWIYSLPSNDDVIWSPLDYGN